MAKKMAVQEDKSELNMLLLGMVAVLAIVGLVLMFNARMTGNAAASSFVGNAYYWGVENPCLNAQPACPNGPRAERTRFLNPDGTMTFTCSCPPTTPPIPDIEVTVQP